MSIFLALVRKNLSEGRWVGFFIGLTLYWLSWQFIWVAHRMETRGRFPVMVSTVEFEMQAWERVPLFMLLPCLWSITRGSALAGEIERGTLDLVMSRPVRRTTYLFSHVLVSNLGLLAIVGTLIAGCMTGIHFHSLREPPPWTAFLKPTLNLAALGWMVYAYTFLLATFDIFRWRPILISSIATIGGYIGHILANTPLIADDYKWVDHLSIFRACRLVEVATTGETFVYNVALLGVLGLICVLSGFVVFAYRDLPAGS